MKFIKNTLKKVLYDDSGFFRDYLGEMRPYRMYLSKYKNEELNYKLPLEYEKEIKKFWKENFNLTVSSKGYNYFFASNQKQNINYIPEDIFFKFIIRKLNKFSMAKAYADKNLYNKRFPDVDTPKTIIRNMNGRFFDEKYNLLSNEDAVNLVMSSITKDKVIVKPSIDSGGGKNITLIDIETMNITNLENQIKDILKGYSKDYIVQYYFYQHDTLNEIYPFSLNTMRIITFETNGKVEILASVLKMGNNSNFLDKVSLGGLSCGINKDGKLNDYAYAKNIQTPLYSHPQTNFEFKGTIIPNFKEVASLVKQLHMQMSPYFRFISWDIALGKDANPVLIEVNLRNQGVMIPQLNCGPIFGEQTKDILKGVLQD